MISSKFGELKKITTFEVLIKIYQMSNSINLFKIRQREMSVRLSTNPPLSGRSLLAPLPQFYFYANKENPNAPAATQAIPAL